MSWEFWSNVMLVVTGVVATITFISCLAAIYVGYMSGKEKDEKAKAQEERIAEIDLKRLEAEREILQLKTQLEPWRLTEGQSQDLVAFLKRKEPVRVRLVASLGENAHDLASDLKAAFDAAGWTAESISAKFERPFFGISLESGDPFGKAPETVQQALKSIGLSATISKVPNARAGDSVTIAI